MPAGVPATPTTAAAAVQPPRPPAEYQVRVLLDNEHVRIEHHHQARPSAVLVVTFDPLLHLAERAPFGRDFVQKESLDMIAVRKKVEHFYQPLTRDAFLAATAQAMAGYSRVVGYGSSLGAYAALYYGRDLDWTVIASSPRNSTHPEFGVQAWQERQRWLHERLHPGVTPRCRAIVLFDPFDPLDRRYIGGEVLPQFPDATVIRVPFSGHPSNQFLGEIGFIAPFVRAVLAGEPAARWPEVRRRALRRKSTSYFQSLATQCLLHGHLAWADALAERALALYPRNMLAWRVRGRVALRERRWAEAVMLLEQALALAPEDGLTLSLVERAREALVQPPAPSTPAEDPQPSLTRRLIGRLRRVLGRADR